MNDFSGIGKILNDSCNYENRLFRGGVNRESLLENRVDWLRDKLDNSSCIESAGKELIKYTRSAGSLMPLGHIYAIIVEAVATSAFPIDIKEWLLFFAKESWVCDLDVNLAHSKGYKPYHDMTDFERQGWTYSDELDNIC